MEFTGLLPPYGLQDGAPPLTSFRARNAMQKRRSPSIIVLSILRSFRKLSESVGRLASVQVSLLTSDLITPVI